MPITRNAEEGDESEKETTKSDKSSEVVLPPATSSPILPDSPSQGLISAKLEVENPLPAPMRSAEEDKRFNLREVSKSASTAITVITYFRANIKNTRKPLQREKLDLITSAIHIHGKVFPEIFFFGINCLLDNLDLIVQQKIIPENLSELVSQILPLAIQFAINSIDFFRTNNSNDYLVFSSFNFLISLVSKLHAPPDFTGPVAKSLNTLMDIVDDQFLPQLSPETCATVIAAIGLFSSLNRPVDCANIFFRKTFFEFSCDMIVGNEGEQNMTEIKVFAFMYISSILKTADGKREIVLDRVFSDPPQIVASAVSILVPLLNQRLALAIVIGFISTVIHSGLRLASKMDEPITDTFFSSLSSLATGTSFSEKVDQVIDSINVDTLDDVFTAYMEDGGLTDPEIPILLNSIGVGLVRFFVRSKNSSGMAVMRKWAVTSATSGSNPYLVASGLELASVISELGNEKFENIIGFDGLDKGLELMTSHSVSWAGDQIMGSLRPIVTEDLASRVFSGLNFHPQMFIDEKWKILFFKKFSIKEIFLRVISVMNWITDIRDLQQVARTSCQMIIAMKTKSVWPEIQQEIVLIESERFRTSGRTGGFFTWMLCALNVATTDWETTEMVLYILIETFLKIENLKQPDATTKIVDGIVSHVRQEFRQKALGILLGSQGPKYKPSGLGKEGGESRPVTTVLASIQTSNTIPIETILEKVEGQKIDEKKTGEVSKTEPGWADSAATWFLDLTEGKSETEDDKKETDEHGEEEKKVDVPVPIESPKEFLLASKIPPKTAAVPPVVPPVLKSGVPKPTPSMVVKSPVKIPPTKMIAGKQIVAKVPVVAGKPPGMMVKRPVAGGPKPVGFPSKTGMAKVPIPVAKKAVPQAEEETEEPVKKEKKKKKVEEEGWGDYLGGFWGAEEPKEKKKKKKKKDESDEEGVVPKKSAVMPKPVPVKSVAPNAKVGGYLVKKAPSSPPVRR